MTSTVNNNETTSNEEILSKKECILSNEDQDTTSLVRSNKIMLKEAKELEAVSQRRKELLERIKKNLA